jgi:hypothetical protein
LDPRATENERVDVTSDDEDDDQSDNESESSEGNNQVQHPNF